MSAGRVTLPYMSRVFDRPLEGTIGARVSERMPESVVDAAIRVVYRDNTAEHALTVLAMLDLA